MLVEAGPILRLVLDFGFLIKLMRNAWCVKKFGGRGLPRVTMGYR